MKTSASLAMFAAALGVVFAAAYGIGSGVPSIAGGTTGHEEASEVTTPAGHGDTTGKAETISALLPGLASAHAGYSLVPRVTTLPEKLGVQFEFTIEGPNGEPVVAYERAHEKELHLILVRRDLQFFQHVHPTRLSNGAWRVLLDFPAAGAYRAFADFQPSALGRRLTLGTDLFVAGDFEPIRLLPPSANAYAHRYDVALHGTPVAGRETDLTFEVTDHSHAAELQPYLGAFGHLVSLRVGDLAYLHTHPAQEAHADDIGGPEVEFTTTFPTEGTYLLFLDFKPGDEVRTATFTVVVGRDGTAGVSAPEPTDAEKSHVHGR